MRFMMMVKSNDEAEGGAMPDEKLLSAMGTYNEALLKAGALITGEGLHASSKGVRVRRAGQSFSVIDGPFAEAKELLGGFWIIQVASKEEAVAWAERVPFEGGEIELRQLYELSDFPVDPAEEPGGWRDEEQRLREAGVPEAPVDAKPARKPGTRRYVVLLKSEKMTESGRLPDQQTLTEMGAFMGEYVKTGALLGGEGLKPSAKGAKVLFSGNKRKVVDGPFTEAKELIAGYSLVQLASKSEVVDFARRWLEIHARAAGTEESEIEIRLLQETEDFAVDPAEKPDGWREQERRFREKQGH